MGVADPKSIFPGYSVQPSRFPACSSNLGRARPSGRARDGLKAVPYRIIVIQYVRTWRTKTSAFAAQRLNENYYGKYIRAAQDGGMAAVCDLDHFKERIEARPSNRATLMAMDPKIFIAAMERWSEQFAKGAEHPVIGASAKDLSSIKIPTCIIPGNDKTHNHAAAETAHRLIAASELYDLFPGDLDVDLVPTEDWAPREAEMAAIFADFLKRAQAKAA